MMDNIRKIIIEEDAIRAAAASKTKARIKANKINGTKAMKSIIDKRIEAKKIAERKHTPISISNEPPKPTLQPTVELVADNVSICSKFIEKNST
jgi:hypothetical protein